MSRVEFASVPCAKHWFSVGVPAALEVSPAISSSSTVHTLGVATSEDSFCVKLLFTFPLIPACGRLSLSFADLLMPGAGERPRQIKLRALTACVTPRSLCHKRQKCNSDQLMRKADTYWLAYLRSLGWQVAAETGGPGLHTPSSGPRLSLHLLVLLSLVLTRFSGVSSAAERAGVSMPVLLLSAFGRSLDSLAKSWSCDHPYSMIGHYSLMAKQMRYAI